MTEGVASEEEGLEWEDDSSSTPHSGRVSITLPKFTEWTVSQIYDYQAQIVDYTTLDDLDHSIQRARSALFKLTDKINEYERKEKRAKVAYERQYRRAYLSSSEKTETAKKARAELKCEDLENTWLTYEQLKNELNRTANSVRLELQTLQAVGNNLRQQLKTL